MAAWSRPGGSASLVQNRGLTAYKDWAQLDETTETEEALGGQDG